MTRLLIATGIFHPESGGPATYLYHLLPHLQAQGFDVHVLTYGTPSAADSSAYPYPVTRIPRTNLRLLGYGRAALPLMGWADVVYAHSALLPLPALPHKPRVLKVVGDQAWERAFQRGWIPSHVDVDSFQIMRFWYPQVSILRRMRRRAVRRATHVIVPSDYLKRMVKRWGAPPTQISVIYNALPPDTPTLSLSQVEARSQLGLDAERPVLLTVARLVPWKGVDALIAALRAVPDAQLIVAGDGDMRPDLEAFAAERGVAGRVTFLGKIPREQVALYMRAADYVALYSGYEGLSHVLLESLRAGTPVIASDKGGNPEVVHHDVNGLLVAWNNLPALEDALVNAFVPGKRAALAANAHVGAEQFAYERMAQFTADVLHAAAQH